MVDIKIEKEDIINTSFEKDYCSIRWKNHHRSVRVKRGWHVKLFGDLYEYYMLRGSEVVKIYPGAAHNDYARLLRDKYGRLWLHVYYSDAFDDRVEQNFDYVESEEQADEYSIGAGYHYHGHSYYFFASEQPDFILHEKTEDKEGNAEEYYQELCELNQIID